MNRVWEPPQPGCLRNKQERAIITTDLGCSTLPSVPARPLRNRLSSVHCPPPHSLPPPRSPPLAAHQALKLHPSFSDMPIPLPIYSGKYHLLIPSAPTCPIQQVPSAGATPATCTVIACVYRGSSVQHNISNHGYHGDECGCYIPEQGHFRLRDESLARFCDLLSCQDRSSKLTVTPPVLHLHSTACPRLQPGLLEGSHPSLL